MQTSENPPSISTLAIWPGSNPPRLGALLKPLGLYTGRLGRSTRKKSPYNKNLQLCWKARFLEKWGEKGSEKPYRSWPVGG
jgi:hypothetical protein